MTMYMGPLPKGPLFTCSRCNSENIVCIGERSENGGKIWERCKDCGHEWVWYE